MEEAAPDQYEVVITKTAEVYYYEAVEYIYEHHSIDRAEKLATELKELPWQLDTYPSRGSKETRLKNSDGRIFRYLLFNRTPRADIKIIYFVDEGTKIVYVTDFFPTEMDDSKITERNR